MRCNHHISTRFIEHRSPFRRWRLCPQAEERQAGGRDDRHANTHGKIDHNRRYGARQNMLENDRAVAGANAARRLDKGLLFENQRIAAHQTGKCRDGENRHGDNHVGHAAAHNRHHRDGQQNTRKGEQHVADTHDDAIPPTFVVARHQPQHGADKRTHQHREDTCSQRDLRTNQHTTENIAPQRIHAEPVNQRRPLI